MTQMLFPLVPDTAQPPDEGLLFAKNTMPPHNPLENASRIAPFSTKGIYLANSKTRS